MDFPQVNHGLLTCYLLQIAPTYEDYNGVLKSLLEIDAGYHVKIPLVPSASKIAVINGDRPGLRIIATVLMFGDSTKTCANM